MCLWVGAYMPPPGTESRICGTHNGSLTPSPCCSYDEQRKMDNAKPCGGAIPLCMVSEFDLPPEIIDRKVGGSKVAPLCPSLVHVALCYAMCGVLGLRLVCACRCAR